MTDTEAPTPTAFPADSRVRSLWVRIAIVAATMGFYILMFPTIFGLIGPAAGAFIFLPAVAAGWLLGRWGGAATALLGIPVQIFLYYNALGFADPPTSFGANLPVIVSAYFVGRASEMQRALTHRNEALVASERRFELASEATHDVIWEHDFRTGESWWNDQMNAVAGYGEGEIPATVEGWLSLVHPHDREQVAQDWGAVVTRGSGAFELQYRIQRKDGENRHVVSRGFIHSEHGMPVSAVGAMTDITSRLQAQASREARIQSEAREKKLREMNEFKSQLINTASHELNTPVSALTLQIHLLRASRASKMTVEEQESFEMLNRNVVRLAGLIGNMLDVARIENGNMRLQKNPTRLEELARDTVETLSPVAKNNGVTIEQEYDAANGEADIDPQRVSQVMFNLVGNALKFTPPGGRVRIRVTTEAGWGRVEVADTGLGMTEEQMSRLYQPFSQVHAARSVTTGAGLGLYISKGIVEEHGGRIACHSPGPGKGTTFTMFVPLKDGASDEATAPARSEPDQRNGGPPWESAGRSILLSHAGHAEHRNPHQAKE